MQNENQLMTLPAEVAQIAENVSVEKKNEVQTVLNHVFNGVSKMREQLDAVVVSDETDKVNMKLANTLRLGVRQVRLEAEKIFDAKRTEVQQQMLGFKTEDALWLKAKQTMQILTKEIEENARWKEKTGARIEAEKKELQTQKRMQDVSKFAPEISRSEFEHMSDTGFAAFLSGIEKQHNDRVEAEKKAEADRAAKEKADTEERERMRIENEKLKAAAAEKEKQIAEAKAKADAEKLAAEAKAAKIKADAEAKLQAEKAKAKAAAEKAAAEKAKLQAEIKAKADAADKARREQAAKDAAELAAKKKAEKAPDKEKLKAMISSLALSVVNLKSEEATETLKLIGEKFQGFCKWANAEIEKL